MRLLRCFTLGWMLCCFVHETAAQWLDDFSDGEINSNVTWLGQTENFTVVNEELQLLDLAPLVLQSALYTSAAWNGASDMEWRIKASLGFSPSDGNQARIYLMADAPPLSYATNATANVHGYFIKLGEALSGDVVRLYRDDASATTLIASGTTNISTSFTIGLRIRRTPAGEWTVEVDPMGGSNYALEASATDLTYNTSSTFGIICTYTSSNADAFAWDDIYMGGIPQDLLPPTLVSAEATSATAVDVLFNEPVDPATATNLLNYNVVGEGNPSQALIDGTNTALVHLSFASAFAANQQLTLETQNVSDLAGNSMLNGSATFIWIQAVPVAFRDVVINELLADPSPSAGLPEVEFVELHNNTSQVMSLDGWQFVNTTTAKTLSNVTLDANGYIVLCDASNVQLFDAAVPVYGISSFTALTNSGDSLTLLDQNGQVIDRVVYLDDWFQTDFKLDGGWTLELINPTLPCVTAANWMESSNPTGGTPGAQNSVFSLAPDNTAPTITGVDVLTANTQITVHFSEALDTTGFFAAAFSIISDPPSMNAVVYGVWNSTLDAVTLTLFAGVSAPNSYTLLASGISDCSNNALNDSFTWTMGFAPQPGDVVIHEIMADPDPSIDLPAAEFIELRNNSNTPISLQGLQFNGAAINTTTIIPPLGYMLVANAQYATNFQGYATVLVEGFPSLTNSGMLLEMTDANGVLLDAVHYDLSWYRDPSRDDGGYTLERIDPITPCTGRLNWHAALNDAGGTPNAANSASVLDNSNAPQAIQFGILDTNAVYIVFDQPMDTLSAALLPSDIMVFNSLLSAHWNEDRDRVVLVFAIPFASESSFFINVEALVNCENQQLQEFLLPFQTGLQPEVGDVIINEIMADGTGTTQALPKEDFIELWNTTTHWLDISTMNVNGISFLQQALIPPLGYVVLTDADSDSSNFSQLPSAVYFITDFPSLTEDGMLIELSQNNLLLDAVSYNKRYYQDVKKESGGFSMERVNPTEPCNSWDNWRACVNPSGTSAGLQNSVYGTPQDVNPPALMHVVAEPENAITLVFSEPISDTLMTEWEFAVNGFPTTFDNAFIQGDEQNELLIPIGLQPADAVLHIQLNGLRDCWMNETGIEAYYEAPSPAIAGDVVINEILYNPLDGGSDFVEIYNASPKTISLKDWKMNDATSGEWNTPDVITDRAVIMAPGDYFILTRNGDHITSFYPNAKVNRVLRVDGMADYSSTDGISLILPNFLTGDELWYDESFHFPLLNSTDGVSLERISPVLPTNESSNWHSAAATSGYATPGYVNSQAVSADASTATWVANPDILSPDNDGYQDVLLLQYTMDLPEYVGTVRIYDSAGQLKRTLKQGELMGMSGEWIWDGLTDEGQKASLGIHVISLEAFHPSGEVIRKKIPCVVAHPIH